MPNRPPCFARLAYDAATSTGYLHFSDGSRYAYPDTDLDDLQAVANALRPGTTFNATLRRADPPYTRITTWPTAPTWTARFKGP
ncbi:MAG: hypothetical protein RMK20_07015 [Verrucomicrobiales bacterium]|nr:hypothetical protein [Verrucomicrobiales bacterium]